MPETTEQGTWKKPVWLVFNDISLSAHSLLISISFLLDGGDGDGDGDGDDDGDGDGGDDDDCDGADAAPTSPRNQPLRQTTTQPFPSARST